MVKALKMIEIEHNEHERRSFDDAVDAGRDLTSNHTATFKHVNFIAAYLCSNLHLLERKLVYAIPYMYESGQLGMA